MKVSTLHYPVLHKSLLALLVCLSLATACGQSSSADEKPLAAASAVSCEYAGANTSRAVKSPRGYTAGLEIKAVRHGKGKRQRCLTSWILLVSGPDGRSNALEIQSREDKPSDNEWKYENSFELIGWSQNGVRLLAAVVTAGGDWDETTPVVYDFQQHKWWRVELAPVFEKVIPEDCPVYFRPTGFTKNGEVLILVAPFDDEDRCYKKSRWALDYKKQTVKKIS